MSDIGIEKSGHVALVEIRRPPNNFFDIPLIKEIADAFESFDEDTHTRAVVLAAQGKAFCAGHNFGDGSTLDAQGRRPNEPGRGAAPLYVEGNRLFRTKKPIIAAVHGAAVGGGLGLAMVADFRVACPETRFCANFTRLGFHPGFGLTVTLPAVVGQTKAALMFYTSRRITGEEAYAMGLADMLVPQHQVRDAAIKLAREISENSPLGLIARLSSAQAPRKMTRVGIATIQPRTGPLWTAFEQRLKELGYAEGENLAVEFIDLNGTVEKELR